MAARLPRPRPPPARFTVGNYEIFEKLGQGAFGAVYRASRLTDGKPVALKRLQLNTDVLGLDQHIVAEVSANRYLQHPNIVPMYDVFQWTSAQKEEYLMLILSLEYSSLDKQLKSLPLRDPRGREERLRFAQEIICGVKYMHNKGLGHYDLKPANILIGPELPARPATVPPTPPKLTAKVADLGLVLSKWRGFWKADPEFLVTLWWRPAELLCGNFLFDHKVDYFSLGVIFLDVFFGFNPFEMAKIATEKEMIEAIAQWIGWPQSFVDQITPGAGKIIEGKWNTICLQQPVSPQKTGRALARSLLPVATNGKDYYTERLAMWGEAMFDDLWGFLSNCLQVDPQLRSLRGAEVLARFSKSACVVVPEHVPNPEPPDTIDLIAWPPSERFLASLALKHFTALVMGPEVRSSRLQLLAERAWAKLMETGTPWFRRAIAEGRGDSVAKAVISLACKLLNILPMFTIPPQDKDWMAQYEFQIETALRWALWEGFTIPISSLPLPLPLPVPLPLRVVLPPPPTPPGESKEEKKPSPRPLPLRVVLPPPPASPGESKEEKKPSRVGLGLDVGSPEEKKGSPSRAARARSGLGAGAMVVQRAPSRKRKPERTPAEVIDLTVDSPIQQPKPRRPLRMRSLISPV